MQPLLQYQALAEPIAPSIPVTLDEWAQPIQTPPRARPLTQYGTFTTMICPLVTLDQWFTPLEVPVRPRHQLRAEWFVGPWSPIIGEDSWAQPIQNPVLPRKQTQEGFYVNPWNPIPPHHGETGRDGVAMHVHKRFLYQSLVRPLEPSLFVVPPLESWERPTNQPVWPRAQVRLGWVADVAAWTPGTLTLDKWFAPLQVPKFLRIGIRPEQYVSTLEPSLFIVPALESWHRPMNEPTRPRPQVRLGWIADIAAWRPPTIFTTIDQWGQPIQQPPAARKGIRPEFYISTLEPSLFVIPALESWHRPTNEPVRTLPKRIQNTNQIHFVGWVVDDWMQPIQTPVRRRPTSPPPALVFPFQVLPLDWLVEFPGPKRQLVTLPVANAHPFTVFQVNLDWLVEYPFPRPPTRPVQPSGSVDPPTGLNVAALLSWAAEVAFPSFPRRSPEGYFVEPFPQAQVTVTLDMWWQEPQYPIRQRLASIQVLQEFVPIVIQVTPTPPCPYRPERTDQESVVDLSVDEGGDQALLVDEVHVTWMRIDGMDVQMAMRPTDVVTGAGRTDEIEVRAGMAADTDALAGRPDETETREGRTDEQDTRAASGDPGDERDNRTDDDGLSAGRRDECSE